MPLTWAPPAHGPSCAGPERQHRCATVIQKHWRRRLAQKRLVALRREAQVQAALRLEARRHEAATTIQV